MLSRRADILVVAVGNPEMVKAHWVKPGAVVLDVGINVVNDGEGGSRVLGDVAFEEVSQVAGIALKIIFLVVQHASLWKRIAGKPSFVPRNGSTSVFGVLPWIR